MSDQRDANLVEVLARASDQLDPIRTDRLAANGYSDVATRISGARVAIDHSLRLAKAHERRGHDAERQSARLQYLLRKLFIADDEYGTGFYNTDKWQEAYKALRAEIGMEVRD